MLEEALKKLLEGKRTLFELAGLGNAVLKGDLRTFHGTAIFKRKQAAIADGHSLDIGSQILESRLPIAHWLAVYDPVFGPDLGRDVLKEFGFLQPASEGSPKQFGERPHR